MDPISILALILFIFISAVLTGTFYDATWVPTNKKNYDRIARLADLQPGMTFYDLGSGNARVLFYLSKKYGVDCVGVEISPFWYVFTKIRSLFHENVKIKYGNFYKSDISQADVIYVFLMPKAYGKFKNKIDKEMKTGGKLILSHWPFKNREPNETSQKEKSASYYLYVK